MKPPMRLFMHSPENTVVERTFRRLKNERITMKFMGSPERFRGNSSSLQRGNFAVRGFGLSAKELENDSGLLAPILAAVVGQPDFAFCGGHFAVPGIGEFDGRDVGNQDRSARDRCNLHPMPARIC